MQQRFPNTHVHFIVLTPCFFHLFLTLVFRHVVDDRLDVVDLGDVSLDGAALILLLLLLVALPNVAAILQLGEEIIFVHLKLRFG